jgi:hypothetical protein
VLVQEEHSRSSQRLVCRNDLGEHVDAVGTFVNHACDTAHLALDATKPQLKVVPVDNHCGTQLRVQAVTNCAGSA